MYRDFAAKGVCLVIDVSVYNRIVCITVCHTLTSLLNACKRSSLALPIASVCLRLTDAKELVTKVRGG